MKKTIRDYDLNNKKVIIRCDFNVPLKDNVITDDNRIKESLETIKYAIDNNAKVILLSHLGRVKEESDKLSKSLKPVSIRLSELLNKEVKFINETRGPLVEAAINGMQAKDIVMLENTRFEDVVSKKESKNDPELGSYWASLGDIYINDAFGTSHRSHASNVGIASHLPSGVGFLIEKELNNLSPILTNPKRPFIVILGGAKVSDKLGVISNLVKIADKVIIVGGMSYTFLKSMGYEVGNSLLDNDQVDYCGELLKQYQDKLVLPLDVVVSDSIETPTVIKTVDISNIPSDLMGLDIGDKTIEMISNILNTAKSVVWNGPSGVFEKEEFKKGTLEIAKKLSVIDADTIVGGGDSASAIINMGFKDKMTHVSTGGGASLEFLEGKALPGIEAINNKTN